MDARRADLHFRGPYSRILHNIGDPARVTLHCVQFDLADVFYQFELPMALCEFFSYAHSCYDDGWTHLSRLARVAAPLSLVLEDNLQAPRLDPPVLSVHVDDFGTICTDVAHVREVGNGVLNGATLSA